MQKPIYSPADEQELMAQLWKPEIADNPYNFVMFAYPWGQPGTPLEKHKGPRKWQRRILEQMTIHIEMGDILGVYEVFKKAVSSGRGPGKSSLVAWLTHWFLSTRIGSTVIISANRESQLRGTTWGELSKWVAMSINAHWWEIVGIAMNPAKWLTQLVEQDLKIGTRYWGAEGRLWSEENPDGYAGAHNHLGMLVIFDEDSGIPESIHSVAQGFFTENIRDRFWFLFGNMRRASGYFFEAVFGSKRDFWDSDVIDARTVEGVDPKVYQEIIDEYGEDSNEARVEVYGLPPLEEEESFIPLSLVNAAVERELPDDLTAPVTIGIDPARGGDRFEICVRQGRKILEIRRFKINTNDDEIGTMEGVGHVIDAIEEFEPTLVVIDETGMGGPIKDRLKEQRYKIRGVNFAWSAKDGKRYGNKRAEMWGLMREWLATADIPNDRRLKTDLVTPRKKPDSAGVMYLEAKKDMKARGAASPDSGDALAVTFAFPIAHREYTEKRGKSKPRPRQTDMPTMSWMAN